MEKNNGKKEPIDILEILRLLTAKKKRFLMVWALTFVISSALILSVPRYYTSSIRLVPEMESSMTGGTLGSLASSFGFDLSDFQTSDAISPLLYPDLMADNSFVTHLFPTHVVSLDGTIDTTYYAYLRKYQKEAWWSAIISKTLSLFGSSKPSSSGGGEFDPYHLSKTDDIIAGMVRGNIELGFDKKNGIISISTKAQDPLICKTLADTVQTYLQKHITEYRTRKARTDAKHYEQLAIQAHEEYDRARQAYAEYSDTHKGAILQSVITRMNDLENDMQLKYNNYTAYNTQLQAANAKVQERTPAFTLLKGAEVPIRPAGPKRMIFVIAMLFIATFVTGIVTCWRYLLRFL